jgi:hypothetical protein
MSEYRPGANHGQDAQPATADAAEARVIREELQRILSGPSFRSSKRCSEFLSFVVERTLDGHGDDLKERTLGVSLFGRTPTYDTPGDPVVRVKANEVRKRLAQYYGDHSGATALRIDLPPGSYVPVFRHGDVLPLELAAAPEPVAAPEVVRPAARLPRSIVIWATVALLAAAGVFALWQTRRESGLDALWKPVLRSDQAPILCVGPSGHVWLLADRLSAQLGRMLTQEAQPAHVDISPNEAVAAGNDYFSRGSVKSAMALSTYLSAHGSRAQVRLSAPLTIEDFRTHTILAVGAFSNPLALQRNSEMRFRFDRGTTDGEPWLGISDSRNPNNRWRVHESPFGSLAIDYALITRMFDPVSKTVFLSLAGLNQFGTEAAAEFITDPRYWKDVARRAPSGWESKNLQVVIATPVVESRPTPPRLVELYVW